eukprot:IDg19842t1
MDGVTCGVLCCSVCHAACSGSTARAYTYAKPPIATRRRARTRAVGRSTLRRAFRQRWPYRDARRQTDLALVCALDARRAMLASLIAADGALSGVTLEISVHAAAFDHDRHHHQRHHQRRHRRRHRRRHQRRYPIKAAAVLRLSRSLRTAAPAAARTARRTALERVRVRACTHERHTWRTARSHGGTRSDADTFQHFQCTLRGALRTSRSHGAGRARGANGRRCTESAATHTDTPGRSSNSHKRVFHRDCAQARVASARRASRSRGDGALSYYACARRSCRSASSTCCDAMQRARKRPLHFTRRANAPRRTPRCMQRR